jgi:hypothetical protein
MLARGFRRSREARRTLRAAPPLSYSQAGGREREWPQQGCVCAAVVGVRVWKGCVMFIYVAQNTSNGHDLFSKQQMMKIIGPASCQSISRVVPVPALRVEVVAQDGTSTGPCHAWTVLFSVVLGAAHRVSAR